MSLMTATLLIWQWTAGCGPERAISLRSASHLGCSFEIEVDYATVFNRIALRARQRYVSIGLPTHQPGVSTDRFPESQSATVTLWDSGGFGLRYRISARIQAVDPNRTRVDLYAAGKSDRREAPLWVTWAATPEQN
jgi:hypothetical protein